MDPLAVLAYGLYEPCPLLEWNGSQTANQQCYDCSGRVSDS